MRRMLPNHTLQAAACALALAALASTAPSHAQTPAAAPAASGRAKEIRTVAMPKLDGANLKLRLLEVTYPPGATSSAHRHPCPVVGYMVSGTMKMQVSDGPLTEYKPGDTFVEMPTDVHRVATNPSADTPAVFTVAFLCDKDTPLSVPEPAAAPR
jgi:quercetin dioxygenase-like cupin family protein